MFAAECHPFPRFVLTMTSTICFPVLLETYSDHPTDTSSFGCTSDVPRSIPAYVDACQMFVALVPRMVNEKQAHVDAARIQARDEKNH